MKFGSHNPTTQRCVLPFGERCTYRTMRRRMCLKMKSAEQSVEKGGQARSRGIKLLGITSTSREPVPFFNTLLVGMD